jgi:4-hydroxy 2-oxovalerate aldolase
VGHGNGLGASSLQVGLSALSDQKMITIARKNLTITKLGVFMLPGFGTIRDDLKPVLDLGADLVCIGAHCTEADVTQQHIEYVKEKGKEAYGILMMCHMASPEKLLEEAKKMQSYGANGVILMDSAGSSTPRIVTEKISKLAEGLSIAAGFHAHNNLGMAVANSFHAIEAGATIIDGTVRGFGAGAGNCALEVLAGLLYKADIRSDLDLYKIMDLSEKIVAKIMLKPQEISSDSLMSGIAGVFSGFLPHVRKTAEEFNIDPRDIFMELGKRKVVAGQEDIIVEVALELANKKAKDQDLSF